MKPTVLFIIAISAVLFNFSCAKNNKEDLLNQNNCDTSTVSYKNDIKPIIDQFCATSGCHDAVTKEAGYILDSYTNVKNAALGNRFLGTIKHEFSPMPKGLDKLDNCTIQKIEAWINQGTLNN